MKKYVALGTISFLAFSSLFSMEVTLFDIISRDERLAHEATED